MSRDNLYVVIGFLFLYGVISFVLLIVREHSMAYKFGYNQGYEQAKEDHKDIDKICIAWWTQTDIKPTIDKICKGKK